MIRMSTQHGWYLVTHQDQARLAESIAREWGNALFRTPQPRTHFLQAVLHHQDSWRAQDASPTLAADGKPRALSQELVGKKYVLDKLHLDSDLAGRMQTVRLVAADGPYAALLIATHFQNLLSDRADRSALAPQQLTLLDRFLREHHALLDQLQSEVEEDPFVATHEKQDRWIQDNFHLLQAISHLSFLACAGFDRSSHLLHPLPLLNGGTAAIQVEWLAPRYFRLAPWPFVALELRFEFPVRHLMGHQFATSESFADAFAAASEEMLSVRLCA